MTSKVRFRRFELGAYLFSTSAIAEFPLEPGLALGNRLLDPDPDKA
jgi:hypothetical protein